MGCRGCNKSKKKFKQKIEAIKQEKVMENAEYKDLSAIRQKEHFMKVCEHGVPAGFRCGTCDKIIEIPADAKVKAKEEPKEKE